MTPHEREVIRQIYPAACRGERRALKILANLTTHRRNRRRCPHCGKIVKRADAKFYTFQCGAIWNQRMRFQKASTLAKAIPAPYSQAFYNESILRNLLRNR